MWLILIFSQPIRKVGVACQHFANIVYTSSGTFKNNIPGRRIENSNAIIIVMVIVIVIAIIMIIIIFIILISFQ